MITLAEWGFAPIWDIVRKSDNVPILLMIVLVGFFVWWGFHMAFQNDRLKRASGDPKADILYPKEEKDFPVRVHVWPYLLRGEFICSVDQFARLIAATEMAVRELPGANIGIAPHSLRAVTPDELAAIVPLAEGRPVHIHAAEQIREVEECIAWSGRRPVEWLLEHAPIDRRWCLIHATHTTATEIASLANSGAVAGLCPVTEASLGDGIFPTREFLDAGGRFGVGTDSNVLVGVADELRQLEYGQRLRHRKRNVLSGGPGISTGRVLLDAALAGGARALAQPIVGLRAGARADIVTLDTTHPSLAGRRRDAVLDGWIFAANAGAVACVWTGGNKVVEGGRHRLRQKARDTFNAAVRRLVA